MAGASVWIHPEGEHLTTATDGAFVFEHLVAGRYHVSARKDDLYASGMGVTVDAGSGPVIVPMRRGATVLVHVVATGSPVPGARVVHDTVTTISDAAGMARVRGLGPGFELIEVTAEGLAPAFLSVTLADDPGATIERTVTMRRGAAVGGVVLGPHGDPVPDAVVDIWEIGNSWGGRATCDEHGAWLFDVLAAGTYRLSATSKTHCATPDVRIELDGLTARRDLVVDVDIGANLCGTVSDSTGQAVAGALVVARPPSPIAEAYQARTNVSGWFEMLGVEVGTYDVFAHEGERASLSRHHAVARGDHAVLDFVLQDASISGIVVDSSGEPIEGARVRAASGNRLSRERVTDEDGRFTLFGLPQGEYNLSTAWPDDEPRRRCRADDEVCIHTGDMTVRLILPEHATLTGRVLLDGEPMPYYGILLTESPQFPHIGQPIGARAADGRFTIRNIAPGTWGIVVIGPGTALTTISGIELEGGAAKDLGDIAMVRGQRISGQVRDAAQLPVPGARVTIGQRNDELHEDELRRWFRSSFETMTDATGAYVFDGVGLHRSTISAAHRTGGVSIATRLPDGDVTLDLTLVAVGAIEGVVEGYSGRLGAVMIRRTDAPDTRLAQVDHFGRFHLEAVPPGDYTIQMIVLPGLSVTVPTITIQVVADQCASARLVAADGEPAPG